MRLLLDTHAFLWWVLDDPELSSPALKAIGDPAALIHVSAASIWEISIKATLGRLDLNGIDMEKEIARSGFEELIMTARHAWQAGMLPRHHDDPFDRMIIAQAQAEELTVVTRDPAFASYGVAILKT